MITTVHLRLEKVTKNYAVYSDSVTGFGKLYIGLDNFPNGAIPTFLEGALSPVTADKPLITASA